jgi:hypothetical protein
MARSNALPSWLGREAALRPWVGCKAPQVRDGRCQRGSAQRQGARRPGPIWPDTWAKHIVPLQVRDLEGRFTGAIRAVAKAGSLGTPVTGMAAGTALEPTERSPGGGPVTRTRRIEAQRGHGHASAGTVYGGKGLGLSDARTQIPLAVKGGPMDEHEPPWTRAVVTHARAQGAGGARLRQMGCDQGVWEGTALWGLAQHDRLVVVPATAHLAVTPDAQAPAAAGAGLTGARRGHPVRPGQGQGARTERWATAVVGSTGLTTDDQSGPPAHGRHATRRACQGPPMNAVVVRQGQGRDDGPGGTTGVVTTASVATPLPPFDDDDDRRLLEHGGSKACQQPWDLGHPPQNTARGGRGPGLCTRLRCALATAYRLPGEQEARGAEPVGWPRGRRQLREQPRDLGIVCAQGFSGLVPLAADA